MTPDEVLAHKPKILTQAQRQFYFDQGYLLVEGVISQEWVARLLEVTEQMVEKSRGLSESDAVFDLEPDHTAQQPRLRRLSTPVDQHSTYWEYASQAALVDVVADLVGPDVKFHHAKLNFKWAEGGEEVKWHQDITYWPHTNYSPLTVGTYLYDVDEDQGPLGVVPGSHQGLLFNQYNEAGNWVGCIADEELGQVDLGSANYLMGPAGSLTIHNCRTIHGSKKNLSPKGRPLLLNAYSAADAFAYTYNPINSPQYTGAIVRGKEARWAYHDPRPCLVPPDWSGGYTSLYAMQQEEG
jgi:ectoine hydroxylase-related dioxygenase (phytanoyl-CoA dioxygenase family)